MALSRTEQYPGDNYWPWAPDGCTWVGEWPPEVWLVKWRLHGLGYRRVSRVDLDWVTEQSCKNYVTRYGYEPPRRGQRRDHYVPVFEHARIEVIDAAALSILGAPKGPQLFS